VIIAARWRFVLFRVSVETSFRASHQLPLPDGSKESVHQHNWVVCANVSGNKLNSMGLVMDFHKLKAMVDDIVSGFDNASFHEIDYFRRNASSAENIAKYVYEQLEPRLPEGVKLRHIKVVEEPGYSVKFGK
jgi:6-pyruvoyltetrahydropterin/6-carboxytetrahydropterin synthase